MRVNTFKKKFLVKDSMYGAENNMFLCMMHKAIAIVLIPNEYHQFRI